MTQPTIRLIMIRFQGLGEKSCSGCSSRVLAFGFVVIRFRLALSDLSVLRGFPRRRSVPCQVTGSFREYEACRAEAPLMRWYTEQQRQAGGSTRAPPLPRDSYSLVMDETTRPSEAEPCVFALARLMHCRFREF